VLWYLISAHTFAKYFFSEFEQTFQILIYIFINPSYQNYATSNTSKAKYNENADTCALLGFVTKVSIFELNI
jgi:hypothetical protein